MQTVDGVYLFEDFVYDGFTEYHYYCTGRLNKKTNKQSHSVNTVRTTESWRSIMMQWWMPGHDIIEAEKKKQNKTKQNKTKT